SCSTLCNPLGYTVHGILRQNTGMQDFFFFFFLLVAALPPRELNVKVAQLLGLWGLWQHKLCRNMDCLHHRSYGPIKVFFQTSCS
ncbi:unnamed protein product, partial [Rangifer tarandus platyrhynchus]